MPQASRTTIFGIMVLADRELTAAQLIALAAPIGLSATNVKSHLTRMVAEGVLKRRGAPRSAVYAVSKDERHKIDGIRARLGDQPADPWDRTWLMLTTRLPARRALRDRLRASLWFDGFRLVNPGVFVRPAWPLPWATERGREYADLTLGSCVRGIVVSSPADFLSLYDLAGLSTQAGDLAARIRRKSAAKMSPRQAFAERVKLGGQVVRVIGHDPRLPSEAWGQHTGVAHLTDAFRKFERALAPQAQLFVDQITGG